MKIQRIGISLLKDNEEAYIQLLSGVLESIDEYCSLMITKAPESFNFRISPSSPSYINSLIENIINLHNLLGIFVSLGKSIKNSSSVSFKIPIL